MIVSRNNLRYNRQGSKDSTSTIASSKSSNSQRNGITSNNNNIHQLYTLRNRSNNNGNLNANPNHNLNYLLYEIPEQYSRTNSSISANSDLISARPPNIRNNSSENKIKIVIKNSDDNPFNNNNNNNGIFKSNYQINFNSSCHNNNKSNNSGSNGKRPHLFSSNGSSTSLSQKSNSSSKQSMSPNSLYSPQLNQVKTGSTSLLTDQHNLTRAITNSNNNNNSNNNIIMSRNNNNNSNNKKFYDEFTLKNNASFLDSISSLNENKNINENGFKSNISKQLRINQKMSHLKNNMEKKDVFANENEKYFYSDVKFINDEINQQYKNLKKQTFTTFGKESEKCFVSNKYNDLILRDDESSNKKLDSEKSTVSENDSSMITPDLLTKLATKVWEEAEKL